MTLRRLSVLFGLYVAYGVLAVMLHPKLIYPFSQQPFAEAGFVAVDIAQGVQVVEAQGQGPAVLYFMGNVGALGVFQQPLIMHQRVGRHVAGVAYPGGGGYAGKPSENLIKAQALVAYDWLVAQTGGPAFVHGYSLGAAVALYVASQRDVKGVILDAPFARMCEQMARRSALPACLLPWVQKWDSLAVAKDVTAPVMIQHGVDDTLIVLNDGRRLATKLTQAGVDVQFHAVPHVGHQTLTSAPNYAVRIDAFIAP